MNDLQNNKKNEIVIFNRDEFKVKFSPKSMRKEFRDVNSLKKAIEVKENSVAYYRKQSSSEFIEGMIEIYLHDLNNSINVHQPLTEDQIEEIAVDIVTMHWQMSLVEIHLVLKKAKRGQYGVIKVALVMSDVLGWFDKYAEERCNFFMGRSISEGSQHAQNGESKIVSEAAREVLNEFKATLPEDKVSNDAQFEIVKNKYNKAKGNG